MRAAVAAIRPAALVIDAPHGEVPLELVFPDGPDRPATPRDLSPRRPHLDRFESLSWTSDQPVSLPRLQRAIARLAPRLARAKGLFETIEQPGRQFLFQLAGGRATLVPAGTPPAGLPRSRIVFITELAALSPAEISAAMDACVSAAAD
jgi:G3E family GTPase